MLGAPGVALNGQINAGQVVVIFGSSSLTALGSLDLNTLAPGQGLMINSTQASAQVGQSVSGAGDLNGDSIADLVLGAPNASPQGRLHAGQVTVIFGGSHLTSLGSVAAGILSGHGLQIDGASAGDQLGFAVSGAGDVNGDGRDDLILGAPGASPGGRTGAGQTVVIFGGSSLTGLGSMNLGALTPGQGSLIQGAQAGNQLGYAVSGAGDINGDNIADLVLGAPTADPLGRRGAGQVTVVFGNTTLATQGTIDLFEYNRFDPADPIDPGLVLILYGANAGDRFGSALSGVGDFSADGIDDIAIGSPYADPLGRSDAGVVTMLFGGPGILAQNPIDTARLTTDQGDVMAGAHDGDRAGSSLHGVVNVAVGTNVVMVGVPFSSPLGRFEAGEALVVVGRTPAVVDELDLSVLPVGRGLILNGAQANDFLGRSFSNVGDFNDDGVADLVIGIYEANPLGRTNAGQVLVIFGGSSLTTLGNLDLESLAPNQGLIINGSQAGDEAGISVSGVGDVNDDGIDDLILGAHRASPLGRTHAGQAIVIFGGPHLVNASSMDLRALAPNQGLVINGAQAGDSTGWSVSSAGDVNGDEIVDLILGAFGADPLGRDVAGQAVVIFGGSHFTNASSMDLRALAPNQGLVINGSQANDFAGRWVSGMGDVNGDGIADVIVGANEADPLGRDRAGQAVVIFGNASLTTLGSVDLGVLAPGQGLIINGAQANDFAGTIVSGVGDVNGDGTADLIIGAPEADPLGRNQAGQAVVIFGSASLTTQGSMDLASLASGQGLVINGAQAGDLAGWSVSGAGDVNGDNINDLIVGAAFADPLGRPDAGQAVVIFGNASLTTLGSVDLGALSPGQGLVINGAQANEWAGFSVSGSGDINSDGVADLVVGVHIASPLGRVNAGQVVVVFGQVPTQAPTTSVPTFSRAPITISPATSSPTTVPITDSPVTFVPTQEPTTVSPITISPTESPTTDSPTTSSPATESPTTGSPMTNFPTVGPTQIPTTVAPTGIPTTASPVTVSPTQSPATASPSVGPTQVPTTVSPTQIPTTVSPMTAFPTESPATYSPSVSPTQVPTTVGPTQTPTTISPTTAFPTESPVTASPSVAPTQVPTTVGPTQTPTTNFPLTRAPATMAPTITPLNEQLVALVTAITGGVVVVSIVAIWEVLKCICQISRNRQNREHTHAFASRLQPYLRIHGVENFEEGISQVFLNLVNTVTEIWARQHHLRVDDTNQDALAKILATQIQAHCAKSDKYYLHIPYLCCNIPLASCCTTWMLCYYIKRYILYSGIKSMDLVALGDKVDAIATDTYRQFQSQASSSSGDHGLIMDRSLFHSNSHLSRKLEMGSIGRSQVTPRAARGKALSSTHEQKLHQRKDSTGLEMATMKRSSRTAEQKSPRAEEGSVSGKSLLKTNLFIQTTDARKLLSSAAGSEPDEVLNPSHRP